MHKKGYPFAGGKKKLLSFYEKLIYKKYKRKEAKKIIEKYRRVG
jgi:hypothetical protein